MNRFMNQLFDCVSLPFVLLSALPTWLFTMVVVTLRKDHPWHPFTFQLQDWALGRTGLCKLFDFLLWEWVMLVAGLAYRLCFGPPWGH